MEISVKSCILKRLDASIFVHVQLNDVQSRRSEANERNERNNI